MRDSKRLKWRDARAEAFVCTCWGLLMKPVSGYSVILFFRAPVFDLTTAVNDLETAPPSAGNYAVGFSRVNCSVIGKAMGPAGLWFVWVCVHAGVGKVEGARTQCIRAGAGYHAAAGTGPAPH